MATESKACLSEDREAIGVEWGSAFAFRATHHEPRLPHSSPLFWRRVGQHLAKGRTARTLGAPCPDLGKWDTTNPNQPALYHGMSSPMPQPPAKQITNRPFHVNATSSAFLRKPLNPLRKFHAPTLPIISPSKRILVPSALNLDLFPKAQKRRFRETRLYVFAGANHDEAEIK